MQSAMTRQGREVITGISALYRSSSSEMEFTIGSPL